MTTIAGWKARETTADAYRLNPPEDLEDAYVIKDGRLREVWDVGIDLIDGQVQLYGNWPDDFYVPKSTPIYYSPPERWN